MKNINENNVKMLAELFTNIKEATTLTDKEITELVKHFSEETIFNYYNTRND